MKAIQTYKVPAAIGPYSQAPGSGVGLVFVSGQLPIDPAGSAVAVKTLPKGALAGGGQKVKS